MLILFIGSICCLMVLVSVVDSMNYRPSRLADQSQHPSWLESIPFYTMLGASTIIFMLTSADHVITYMVFITSFIVLIDQVYWKKQRIEKIPALKGLSYKQAYRHEEYGEAYQHMTSPWIKTAREFFVSLLVLWLVTSFIVHPYRVPTGSLQPTIDPGDMLIANKFSYGIRMPLTNQPIYEWNGQPKRGDIVTFSDPTDAYRTLVKRVVGMPGDHIYYNNKQLFINDQPVALETIGLEYNINHFGQLETVIRQQESLPNKTHEIFIRPHVSDLASTDVVIPDNHYFMMGDNRDASSDSRYFGPVSFDNIGGKAWFVWMSIDPSSWNIRWDRIGKSLT